MLQFKTEDITIAKIIENYRSGLWSIPESLSDYEWKKRKSKAVTFIANLYQGRPVSGMTIWEAPEAMDSDGQFEAPKHPARILDGQQKIMTFCKLIDGASDLKILFNPRVTDGNKGSEGQFRVESAITRNSEGWVDVGKVIGSKEDFFNVLRNEESEEHGVRLIRLREILNTEISVVKYLGHDYVSIAKAFELWKMKRKRALISV
ncbi:MAG: hypothetical protein FWE95_00165 [Planctomycetaceae bacterium]|nr:hypothetical protein [Planctomycetaceae bacterium]